MNTRIGARLMLGIGGVLILTVAVLGGLAYRQVQTTVAKAERSELTALFQSATLGIAGEARLASALAAFAAAEPRTQSAFAARDRDTLRSLYTPVFEALSREYGAEQFQFHLAPATSFLRLHEPEKFGDDLSGFRQTVVAANTEDRTVRGLESGVAGFGIRGVVPVHHAGKAVGTVEFGMRLDQAFFDRFKNRHGAEIAFYEATEGGFVLRGSTLADAEGAPRLAELQRALDATGTGEVVVRRRAGADRAVLLRPLDDYEGKPAGVLEIAFNRSSYAALLDEFRVMVLFAGLTVLLVGFGLAYWLTRAINQQRQLEQQLQNAQRMESIGRLTGGVAHDFNNFLTVIQGFASLIESHGDELHQEVRESTAEIAGAAQGAATLTRQLLAYSRQQVLEPTVLDLNALIASTHRMLVRLLGEHIQFDLRLSPELGCVYADAGQLQQVLMNLAVNARDAMPEAGRLSIATRNETVDGARAASHPAFQRGRYVVMEVADTGHGMDKATLDQIFDPFFTTKAPGEGTGLGLSTVYGIVKQSGGFIWPYSEPSIGTTFRIYLPAASRRPSAPEATTPRITDTLLDGSSWSVLVVDDEDPVRRLVRKALERRAFTVMEAESGSEALAILEQSTVSIDLLLTDMAMPAMGGKELGERAHQVRPDLPIVYMSGYSKDFLSRRGDLEFRATVLEKPFTPARLLDVVAETIEARGVAAGHEATDRQRSV